MSESFKISDNRFPRLSMICATLFFLMILLSLNSEILGDTTTTKDLQNSTTFLVLSFGVANLILWLGLRFFKREWTFERPLRIGIRSGFKSEVRFFELPAACTLLRRGRELVFLEASSIVSGHDTESDSKIAERAVGDQRIAIAILRFSTQRAAILNENRLLEFLDPDRVLPIESTPPLTRRLLLTPVTFTLITLNVVISLYAWFRGDAFVMSGSLSRAAMADGEYYRLLSNTFLHYNGIHLTMNMLALWSLGVQVEKIIGRVQILLVYLISGLCGGLWALQFIGPVQLLGASGAVFGLFGAIAYFIFLGRDLLPATVYLPTRRQLSTDLMINAGLSLLPFVSFSAHFGGFVSGFIASGVIFRARLITKRMMK